MEFTHEPITEIISEITNGEQGLQGLVKQGYVTSLTLKEAYLNQSQTAEEKAGEQKRLEQAEAERQEKERKEREE